MKMYRTIINPAFKKTQPLPVLPANFKGRAGRAAMALSRLIRPQGATSPIEMDVAQCAASVRQGFNAPALSLMG